MFKLLKLQGLSAAYHCLFVSFLDRVAQDLCVAIILWRCPLQGNIKSPNIGQFYILRRARLIWRGDMKKNLASASAAESVVISSHAG